ncbi:MAG: glutaredoxin 3 [Deltaproteobacteria bacterium]|nr:MAG: glutaredoxin 3 [Deltaproteobacteria bacterium]
MVEVIIYSTQVCPYCVKAKQLLSSKGVDYKEIDISQDPALVEEVQTRSGGRRTVPQIFIGDYHVGGCDDLFALDAAGELDAFLKK